jgi:hypothetical protein
MARPKKTAGSINKSAFVRSLPSSMPAADVVKAAKAKGITLTDKYVHTIRYNAKTTAKKKPSAAATTATTTATAAAPVAPRRGPGRPPRAVARPAAEPSNGLVAELERLVERVVERKIGEVLRAKLGGIL